MGIIGIVIALVVVGVVLQLIKEYVEPKLYIAAIVIIILVICLLILNAFGLTGFGPHLR